MIRRLPAIALASVLAATIAGPGRAHGQAVPASDSFATLRVLVRHEFTPVAGATVRVGRIAQATDVAGTAALRLSPGAHTVVTTRIGFAPDTAPLSLRAGQDTLLVVELEERAAEIEAVIVEATRAGRRVEDTPVRVEVVDEEEVAEKTAMTPGDVAMMLNETSGLRVQTTSPSLGGANVRVQGLRGRYTLLLADGLPLYGAQAGGLGLLQIPPVDLARAEIIKGTASALYGPSALGGVINFVSRRPGATPAHDLLVNQTTRGGSDAVAFLTAPLGAEGTHWGGTFLASAHRQRRNDIDADGWADMPGYERIVARPRVFYGDEAGRSVFATTGLTAEDREGGTVAGAAAPDGRPYVEGLRTRRADAGLVARTIVAGRDIVTLRGSGVEQRHRHQFGGTTEDDRHRTWFGELSAALPRGRATFVVGAAYQTESYANDAVPRFDYAFQLPAAFAQVDLDVAPWLVTSVSARLDHHSRYGTTLSPRGSLLLRAAPDGLLSTWTARLSAGGGTFAPVPFTEETEVTGLTPLRPLSGLVSERAVGGSADVGGSLVLPTGELQLNASLHGSRLSHPAMTRDDVGMTPAGASYIGLVNAPVASRTWGAEALARWLHGPARLTATYAYLRASEWDAEAAGVNRRDVPLAPRHTAGVVASLEREGESRLGLELYYTGRQALEDNPYRATSQPYVVLGLLVERHFGRARLFVNGENLLDVRQTRVDPLLLPVRGAGGRWTTDVWSLLEGRTVNAGVRLALGTRRSESENRLSRW